MLWFSVWTVLVLATLGGAFLLGRRLWRSAVALGRELGRAADVAAQLAERVDELQAAAEPARHRSDAVRRPAVLRARLDALREAAAGRRADASSAHVATRLRVAGLLALGVCIHPQVTRVLSAGHRDSDGGPDVLRNLSAWHVLIVLLVVVLLFGAKRLPDLAKSVGQSMKIFKNEVKDLRDDDAPPARRRPRPPLRPHRRGDAGRRAAGRPPGGRRRQYVDPGPARRGADRGHRPAEGLTRT